MLCVALEGLCVLLEYVISASVIYARIALVAFKKVVILNQCGQNPRNKVYFRPNFSMWSAKLTVYFSLPNV